MCVYALCAACCARPPVACSKVWSYALSTGNIKRTPVLNPVQRVQARLCTHNCGEFSQSRMTSSADLPSSRINFTLAVSFFFSKLTRVGGVQVTCSDRRCKLVERVLIDLSLSGSWTCTRTEQCDAGPECVLACVDEILDWPSILVYRQHLCGLVMSIPTTSPDTRHGVPALRRSTPEDRRLAAWRVETADIEGLRFGVCLATRRQMS